MFTEYCKAACTTLGSTLITYRHTWWWVFMILVSKALRLCEVSLKMLLELTLWEENSTILVPFRCGAPNWTPNSQALCHADSPQKRYSPAGYSSYYRVFLKGYSSEYHVYSQTGTCAWELAALLVSNKTLHCRYYIRRSCWVPRGQRGLAERSRQIRELSNHQ